MPVRKVSSHRGSAAGRFPSLKMNRMIAFESLLERDFIYLLDYEPSVTWFEEQPMRIEYEYEAKQRHYTPDFLIVEQKQPVLVECKPERFADTEENRRKFAVARHCCQEKGWQFRVVTEQEIRSGFRLQNIRLLTQYARQCIDPFVSNQVLEFLQATQSVVPIRKVVQNLTALPATVVMAYILYMAYHHQIGMGLDQAPISQDTCISVCLTQQTGGGYV